MISIHITDKSSVRERMLRAWQVVNEMLDGGGVLVEIKRFSRSRDQEKKYHAMIRDIARQVKFDGRKTFSTDVWKARLVEQFAQDRADMGEPLNHPGQTVMSLDSQRIISVRPSTTQFTVQEGRDFIEHLYSEGAEMGVVWSEPVMEFYRDLVSGAA